MGAQGVLVHRYVDGTDPGGSARYYPDAMFRQAEDAEPLPGRQHVGGLLDGFCSNRWLVVHDATISPRQPPTAASSRLSTSSWPTIRPRLAPIAILTAISCVRWLTEKAITP